LMAFSWGAVSGSFIGPYIWGIYNRRITRIAAYCGMISGLGTVLIGAGIALLITPATATSWAPRLAVLAMVVSFIVTPLASLLTQKIEKLPEGAKAL
jgi:SSS family solute:Na+ symporter